MSLNQKSPEPNIGFARSGDKTGVLSNRQCKKCGGSVRTKESAFYCDRCGPQAGKR